MPVSPLRGGPVLGFGEARENRRLSAPKWVPDDHLDSYANCAVMYGPKAAEEHVRRALGIPSPKRKPHLAVVTPLVSKAGARMARYPHDAHVSAWREAVEGVPVSYSVPLILEIVAEATGVSVSEMQSQRRPLSIAKARQIAFYLARRFSRRSLPEIGRRIGDRDHTTVLHGCRRVAQIIASQNISPAEPQGPAQWANALWSVRWPIGVGARAIGKTRA